MKTRVIAVVSCLVMWHGLLQSVPHHHADAAVSQERLACSASHPLSQEFHLHGAGESVDVHLCLACAAGSAAALSAPADGVAPAPDHRACAQTRLPDFRSHHRRLLPFHRGPPAAA